MDFNLSGGTQVMGFISPFDTNDTYAVIDPLYGIDGFRNVTDLSALNAIPNARRRAGMVVGVSGGTEYYKLKDVTWSGVTADWTSFLTDSFTGNTSGDSITNLFVDNLNIKAVGSGTSVTNLGWDSSGNVVSGITGGGLDGDGIFGGSGSLLSATTISMNTKPLIMGGSGDFYGTNSQFAITIGSSPNTNQNLYVVSSDRLFASRMFNQNTDLSGARWVGSFESNTTKIGLGTLYGVFASLTGIASGATYTAGYFNAENASNNIALHAVNGDVIFETIGSGTSVTNLGIDSSGILVSGTTGGGSGEVNTASNVGSGNEVFDQKVGTDLQFRTLSAGTNVTITSGATTLTINSSGGGSGGGDGIYGGSGSLSADTTVTNAGFNLGISGTGNLGVGTTAPDRKLTVNVSTLGDGIRANYNNNLFGIMNYAAAGGQLALYDNLGVLKVFLSTVNSYFTGGNLSIGTTSASQSFNIASSVGNAGISLNNTGASGVEYLLTSHSTGSFQIYDLDNSAARFYIQKTTGNVGIGTTTPTEKLDVIGNSKISGTLNLGNIGSGTSLTNLGWDSSGNVVSGTTGGGSGGGDGIYGGSGSLSADTTVTMAGNTLNIDGGSLTLSTSATTQGYFLENTLNNTIFKVRENNTTNDSSIQMLSGDGLGVLVSLNNATDFINTGKNFGIRTNAPLANLHLTASAHNNGFSLYQTNGTTLAAKLNHVVNATSMASSFTMYEDNGTTAGIQLGGASATVSFINDGNNFGIGTVTPTQKLDVAGNALITGKLTIDATPDALQINHVNGRLTIGTTANDGGTHIWQRGTRGNLMSLGDASTQRLLVTSNGSTLISHTNASGSDYALRVDSLTVANLFRVDGDSNNIGIGTGAPSDSALVDMTSTTKGFLLPRLTTTQRDAIVTPATGLSVYNTTTDKINFYNGAAWEAVSGGSFNGIYDGSGSLTTGTTITSGGYDLNITGTGKFGVSGDIQFLSTAALESDTIKIVQSTGTTGTTGGIITFDGQTGGLFAITDDKDGQLFGVADVSGNDIMYADADWLIKMGNPFQLSGSPFELKYDDVSGNTTLSTNAINVNLNVQNITSTGVTSNIDVTKSIIKISTTTSADLLTLPDGVEGQVISIIYVAETAGADDVTITPTNLLGYTTIFLTLIGTGCELYFTDGSWVVKSQNNVTLS